jgi:hypothetical protein
MYYDRGRAADNIDFYSKTNNIKSEYCNAEVEDKNSILISRIVPSYPYPELFIAHLFAQNKGYDCS